MCGLAGVAGRPGHDPDRSLTVRRMTATLVHRGPDGEGHAERDGCDLGFRRLSIRDLEACAPPYSSEDGTVWTVCNGEIYNADALRARLESRGHRFRTGVDTEVLPHLYEEMGSSLVDHLDGMFAFAVWDEPRRELFLGRDRAGEKPLFYWTDGQELVFASELRALQAHPRVPAEMDPAALSRYLLHDYFPAPLTPFRDVRKLPAGHVLTFREGRVSLRRYWDLADHFGPTARGAPARIAEELDHRIAVAVERRRLSDTQVGVFLSGGIDSSTILAHMAEQLGPGVPAFALGHADRSFDEARFARDTARHFAAEYHELILDRADLDQGLRRIADGMDEPLGDASTIPTHLLALFARRRVKVILSGEGADELFGGYPTYLGDRLASLYGRLPGGIRRLLAGLAGRGIPNTMGNVSLDYLLGRFLSGAERERTERHHVWFGSLPPERQAQVLAPRVLESLGGDDPFGSARATLRGRSLPDSLAVLLYTDFTMYLQDDLLTKVDRATMLASLEARAPFLDHELAEFVAGLPSALKVRGMTSKAILRKAQKPRLPAGILSRRKKGFNIPFSRWLLEGLGGRLLRERFSPERLEARGILSTRGVTALLEEHLSRRADHRKPLYTLLALDLWLDRTYGQVKVPIAGGSATRVAGQGAFP